MRTFLLALSIAFAPVLSSELAPEVYRAMQREAPELLQLAIGSVEVDRDFRKPSDCGWLEIEIVRNVVARARVVSVIRSRAGVRPGTSIEIRYASIRRCSEFAGPRSIPMVSEGTRVFAFLRKTARGFEPAARGASFAAGLAK